MQWIIATLINVLLQLLEASFRKPQHHASPKDNNAPNDSDFFSDNPRVNPDAKLAQAYKFLELAPPVSEEELKKQYKKLSLRYHPDRNGGTEESKANFQKLRACMDLVEKDVAGVDENSPDNENEEDEVDEDDYVSVMRKQQEAQEEARKRWEEMHRAREKEMQEEMERQQKQREEFQSHVKHTKQRCSKLKQNKGLTTDEARTTSHEKFEKEVAARRAAVEEAEQEEQAPKSEKTAYKPSPKHPLPLKPRDTLMECCANEVVIAMRMGLPEMAFKCMNDELPEFAREQGQALYFQGIKATPQRLKQGYFTQRLDEDGNNLFHYAIYYECYQVVNTICGQALREGYLTEILEQTNDHGNDPFFFAQIGDDTSILTLLQHHKQMLEDRKKRTRIIPALKAVPQRLGELMGEVGFFSTLDTFLSFWIARYQFHFHILTCIIALGLTQAFGLVNSTEHGESFLAQAPGVHEFSVHICFCILWVIMKWLAGKMMQYLPWELLAILATFVLAVLWSTNRILFPLIIHARLSDQLTSFIVSWKTLLIPSPLLKRGLSRTFLLVIAATGPRALQSLKQMWQT